VSDGAAQPVGTRADSHRLCGIITQTAKSRSAASENIANVMLKEEQKNHLPYVLPMESDNETYTFEGRDGRQEKDKIVCRHSLAEYD